jgi:hypothetical protein
MENAYLYLVKEIIYNLLKLYIKNNYFIDLEEIEIILHFLKFKIPV